MSDAELLIAFAGSGSVTPANVRSLLDDQLIGARDVKEFIVPDKISEKTQPGLANVVAYLTKYWGDEDASEDPFKAVALTDFTDTLIEARDTDKQEPVLVIIAGDEGADDATADLAESVIDSGIRVLDLAAGLDEVTATEDDSEEVLPEPEPEPAPTKRRRRTEPTPEAEKPAPARTRGKPRTRSEIEDIGTKALDDLKNVQDDAPPFDPPFKDDKPKGFDFSKLAQGGPESVPGELVSVSNESLRELLIVALRGALSALEGVSATEEGPLAEPYGKAGWSLDKVATPPANGPTTAYIRDDESGALRKRGRGKPRAGETAVYLTPAQEKEQGLK